jgi:hypothetical protein
MEQHQTVSVRQSWLRAIIKAIWVFNKTMWTHRNSILHSTEIPLCELRKSTVNTHICSLYDQQQDFAVLDQVIFDTPLAGRPPTETTLIQEALDPTSTTIPSVHTQQKNWKSTTYYQFLPSTHCSYNTKEKQ